jgi:hypothetical protein
LDLFKKLATLFAVSAPGSQGYSLSVQCNRCGEVIQTQINLANDLSVEYGEDEKPAGYYCRKLLMGKQRCFQQIEVVLTFDSRRKLIDRKIEGGKFVE